MTEPIDLERLPPRVQSLLTHANMCLEQRRMAGWGKAEVVARMLPIAEGDIDAIRHARAASLAIYSREGTPEERELEDEVRSTVVGLLGVDIPADEVDRREMDEILAWTEAAVGA